MVSAFAFAADSAVPFNSRSVAFVLRLTLAVSCSKRDCFACVRSALSLAISAAEASALASDSATALSAAFFASDRAVFDCDFCSAIFPDRL